MVAQPSSRLDSRRLCARAALLLLAALAGCAHSNGRPWVHKIYVHGNQQVKAGDITDKLAVRATSWFPLAPKRYLEHPFAVEMDRSRIEAYYQTRGFFAAKVTKAEVTPYKNKPAVDIHYTVKEGEPTRIENVVIDGLDGIGEDGTKVRARVALQPGQVFEHAKYLEERGALQQRLQTRGYAFAQTTGQIFVDREARLAQIQLYNSPGRKLVLGQTLVRGTVLVDPEAVKKHAAVRSGDVYQPAALEAVQGKLYGLGIFSNVRVEPIPSPSDPGVADVQISVGEGKFRELKLGIGLGLESLRTEVHGEVTFIQRRFLGGLRTLQLTLQPGYAAVPAFWASDIIRHGPMIGFKAEFTQPDLLGFNSVFTASLAYDVGIDYAYQYHGPGLRFGVSRGFWKDRIKLAASYNFQFLDFFATDPAILNNPGQSGALYGYLDPYRLGYFQEQAVLDLRQRGGALDVRRGVYLALLAEQGGVYSASAFDYQKLMPEIRGYVSAGNRVTFAARIQFGHMFVQGEQGSPITQRFYLGGPNSHRGFTYNRLSYQVCSATRTVQRMDGAGMAVSVDEPVLGCVNPNLQDPSIRDFRRLPIGGDELLLAQLEVRINLFRLFGRWFSFAAFTDAGDVAAPAQSACTQDKCDAVNYGTAIDLTKLHIAVGGGVRYNTVIGTIRFDLGVRLNRLEQFTGSYENPDPDARFAYHISIGEAF